MGLFSGCLFACDIDGTLMASGFIHPRNIEKIEYFISEGGYFSLSTGRTVSAVSMVTDKIKNLAPSVVANGCMIYDFKNNKVLDELFLPKSTLSIVKSVAENTENIGIEAHSADIVIKVKETEETIAHQVYEKMKPIEKTVDELQDYRLNKVLFAFLNEQERNKASDTVGKAGEGYIFYNTTAEIDGRVRYYYEMLPFGVSKSSALDKLKKMLKIDSGYFFAMGDYYNDLDMIKNADISAVTKNTPEDIKQYADFVAGSCEDGAVADFIDYLTEKRKEWFDGSRN